MRFNKFYSLLIIILFTFSIKISAQVAGSFEIITMKDRWGSSTNDYLNNNGFKTGARLLTHSAIFGSGDENKVNLSLVRNYLEKSYANSSSTGYLIIDWETGPYFTMRNNSPSSNAFKNAENEYFKLINEVRRLRPNVKICLYMMPYRFWYASQNENFNTQRKFDNLLSKVDFIAPSVYIMFADEEVGQERNLRYIKENIEVALEYGKRLDKPVYPFVWHRLHPSVSEIYNRQIMQKEVFAKYIKLISSLSVDNKKVKGIVWWDAIGGQLKNLNGIKNCLRGSVYNKDTYDDMIVKYAKHLKDQLQGDETPDAPSSSSTQKIVSYSLINADTDKTIQTIKDGETLDLADLPTKNLNIKANTYPDPVGSVKFILNGAESKTRVENGAPFGLFTNSGSNFYGWTPTLGTYTLQAIPYSSDNAEGSAGSSLTISFKFVNSALSNATLAMISKPDLEPETSLEESKQILRNVTVSPIPANTTLTIKANGTIGTYTISIYDLAGLQVLDQKVNSATTELLTKIDVSNLNKGQYILKIKSPDGQANDQHILID